MTGDAVTGGRESNASAWEVAAGVADPELPVLTLADLGVLRDVRESNGAVTVSITPTYSGCPALDAMREDLIRALKRAGFAAVEVRTVLSPAWTTDAITAEGRRKLTAAGIAPPAPVRIRENGPVPLTLQPAPARVPCPRCGSPDTALLSLFGATACRALRRCRSCDEPFEHVKEV